MYCVVVPPDPHLQSPSSRGAACSRLVLALQLRGEGPTEVECGYITVVQDMQINVNGLVEEKQDDRTFSSANILTVGATGHRVGIRAVEV